MEAERGGHGKKTDRGVCVREIENRERLIQPDTYKVKAEGEMHTNRDTKRQRKWERRTETLKETAEKKRD